MVGVKIKNWKTNLHLPCVKVTNTCQEGVTFPTGPTLTELTPAMLTCRELGPCALSGTAQLAVGSWWAEVCERRWSVTLAFASNCT